MKSVLNGSEEHQEHITGMFLRNENMAGALGKDCPDDSDEERTLTIIGKIVEAILNQNLEAPFFSAIVDVAGSEQEIDVYTFRNLQKTPLFVLNKKCTQDLLTYFEMF